MKKMVKWILKNILSLLVLVLAIINIYFIVELGVLPIKYLLIIIGIVLFIYLIGFILYNRRKIILIIFGVLFYIASISSNVAILYYVYSTNSYMNDNFSLKTYKVTTEYYLVAPIWSSVNSLPELDPKQEILYYKYGKSINKAMGTLGNFTYIPTDNVLNALTDISNSNHYLFIPSARYKYVVNSSNLVKEDQFKIIGIYNIDDEIPINNDNPDSYNIYINGLDLTGIKRDFNMIITVNTKTRKVVLTSIPRDYYIDVPAYGIKDTLMCMGDLDPEVSKGALEELFNTKIDYTININTTSLVSVVDRLGGLELCSDANDVIGMVPGVYSGCRTYNGKQVLSIARYRMNLPGRDRSRQKNIRLILLTIAKKVASFTTLTNYNEVLHSFDGLYTSDINKDTLTNLISKFIENPKFTIIEQDVDGTDSVGMGHLNTEEAWNMTPDMNTVNAASKQINSVLKEK